MCLVTFAHETEAYALVLAANRDEAYDRPTDAAAFWRDAPDVFGGRDREHGGTWLALSTRGRLAAVTNVRRGASARGLRSRGELCASFARGGDDADAFAARAAAERDAYGGFNLVVCAGGRVAYASSDASIPTASLAPGVYGLSNASLDVAWPKVERAKQAMRAALELPEDAMIDHLFAMLADRSVAADDALPDTGVPQAVERALSAVFVASERYGTRCSTVIAWRRDGAVAFEERTFGPRGAPLGVVRTRLGVRVG